MIKVKLAWLKNYTGPSWKSATLKIRQKWLFQGSAAGHPKNSNASCVPQRCSNDPAMTHIDRYFRHHNFGIFENFRPKTPTPLTRYPFSAFWGFLGALLGPPGKKFPPTKNRLNMLIVLFFSVLKPTSTFPSDRFSWPNRPKHPHNGQFMPRPTETKLHTPPKGGYLHDFL